MNKSLSRLQGHTLNSQGRGTENHSSRVYRNDSFNETSEEFPEYTILKLVYDHLVHDRIYPLIKSSNLCSLTFAFYF